MPPVPSSRSMVRLRCSGAGSLPRQQHSVGSWGWHRSNGRHRTGEWDAWPPKDRMVPRTCLGPGDIVTRAANEPSRKFHNHGVFRNRRQQPLEHVTNISSTQKKQQDSPSCGELCIFFHFYLEIFISSAQVSSIILGYFYLIKVKL